MCELSEIENRVIQLICEGQTSAQIGERLFKSPRTIEGYTASLYEKLGVNNKAELISYAFKHGLYQD